MIEVNPFLACAAGCLYFLGLAQQYFLILAIGRQGGPGPAIGLLMAALWPLVILVGLCVLLASKVMGEDVT